MVSALVLTACRRFFGSRPRYWGALQEAWDGPALVAFCDGEYMGLLVFLENSQGHVHMGLRFFGGEDCEDCRPMRTCCRMVVGLDVGISAIWEFEGVRGSRWWIDGERDRLT